MNKVYISLWHALARKLGTCDIIRILVGPFDVCICYCLIMYMDFSIGTLSERRLSHEFPAPSSPLDKKILVIRHQEAYVTGPVRRHLNDTVPDEFHPQSHTASPGHFKARSKPDVTFILPQGEFPLCVHLVLGVACG